MNIAGLLFSLGARRRLAGGLGHVVTLYAACLALWVVWAATLAIIDPLAHGAIFVSFMLAMMFLVVAPGPGGGATQPLFLDYAFCVGSLACGVYFSLSAEAIASRISLFDALSAADLLFGTLLWLLAVEATRRAVGLALTMIVLLFVAYNLLGHLLDGVMSHGVISYEHFLDQSVFTTNGVFGVPVRVAATYAFLFVIFGVIFQRVGGGQFFFDLAAAVTGRSPGGSAKVAIASSALYGTMSGSPTADVVTTGSVTIPMMVRRGFSPVMAGAVEVAASTGGSILPPVMGSAAFIMVELTGIEYQTVALAAAIPALLFYAGLYVQVHLRSVRLGLGGVEAEEIPPLRETLRSGGVFALPLLTIVVALLLGFTPTFVAILGTVAALVASLPTAATRISLRGLYDGLAEATLRMVPVAAACAAAGLVVGGLSLTGLAGKFSYLVFALAGDHLFISLVLAGALCVLLGMGMPTPSVYILAAVLVGDVLTSADIDPLPAHMFLLFFSALSAMTPPVAVAAYAAASIADANPLAIGAAAVRLSLTLVVLPFAFVYGPALLGQGSPAAIIWAAATGLLGVGAIAAAAEGYLRCALSWQQRVAMLLSGICLLTPGVASDAIGFLVGALVWWNVRRTAPASAGHGA